MLSARRALHEDTFTLVEHLDELRTRILISLSALGLALGLCFWQNHLILEGLDRLLPDGRHPITFGVTEPFMTTLTVTVYAALILALPVLLYEAYAFIGPALAPDRRRLVSPFLIAAPVLFLAGVAFAYEIVVPAALKFLLHFNNSEFNIQIRAREFYGFVSTTLVALGLVFQLPLAILAATRLGIVTTRQLSRNRRYAYLAIAVVAMVLPGTDPVTMLVEMTPLIVLFELSLLLSRWFGGAARASVSDGSSSPGVL